MTDRPFYNRERNREGRRNYDPDYDYYDRFGGTQFGYGPDVNYEYYEPGYRPRGAYGEARDWGYGHEWGPGSYAEDYGGPVGDYRDWTVQGPFTGYGPQGYHRSDERIHEDANDRLTRHGRLDASHIVVEVARGEVTLKGEVPSRRDKRRAEDTVESVAGVRDVHNQLQVKKQSGQSSERNVE